MGVTNPNGDPVSEAIALEDLQSDCRFTVEEDDLEGFAIPGLYVVLKTGMDDKEVTVKLTEEEVQPGEWELVYRGRAGGGEDGD